MSIITVVKDRDALVFASDSRMMAHDYSGIDCDDQQKIFEVAADTFIATSGRKIASEFQIGRARELAIELGTADIQVIAAALERESLPQLGALVERLRLEPDGITRQAVSGETLLHCCALVGRTAGGKLGYVAHSYAVQADGTIGCTVEAYFEAPRKIFSTSGASASLMAEIASRFAHDVATWTDPPEQVSMRFLEAVKHSTPTIGGPYQVVRLDAGGTRWISRPPQRAAVPLAGNLSTATCSAAISLTAPTLVISGSGWSINLDSANGFKMTKGSSSVTINGASGSNLIQVTDGSSVNNVQPGLFNTYTGSVAASLSATGSSGQLQLSNASGGLTLTNTGFAFVGTGSGVTTAFTGTLAAAIAAGKSFQGGILIN